MSINLYMKTDKFTSNKEMAEYFLKELSGKGIELGEPIDEGYMYIIEGRMEGESVSFYMGKNDEVSVPPLWQVWPEQKVSLFKKLFGKTSKASEEKARKLLEEIANNIPGVQGVEWDI